ncbi:MAG TPA: DUF1801 domain-containing protein [Acidimicrobiales bacterium]|nr:DUF1801 domain-containing protein [Acidimicrobiales bacterium]
MSAGEIDEYLKRVPTRQRAVLERLRGTIVRLVPDAEQCLSYRVPAFCVDGVVVGGFASLKNHMSYLPFSGSVLDQLSPEVDSYSHSKSAPRFTLEAPLPDELVGELIRIRLSENRAPKR